MLVYFFLFVFPIAALASLVLYAPWALLARRKGKRGMLFHLPRYTFVGYLLSLVYLTLLFYYPDITFHPDHHFLNLRPFVWVTETYDMGVGKMLWQLAMNAAMFVPLGLLLPVIFRSMRKWYANALTVLLTTVSIETLQYFMGRSADIDDVLMNLAGGLLGWCIFSLMNKKLSNSGIWKKLLGQY